VGKGEGDARQVLLDQASDRQFVGGVDDRPEETYRDRFDALSGESFENFDDALLFQRVANGAVPEKTLRDLEG
jgi:hypothetical protein